MVKRFRGDEVAARLGLPASVIENFVSEGMLEPCDTAPGAQYFRQDAIDRLIHELHSRIQRASWRDMEDRMEEVERRIEQIESRLGKQAGPGGASPF